MSHKRTLSHGEAPLPKRQDQKPSSLAKPASTPSTTATSTDQYVYVLTEQMYIQKMEDPPALIKVFAMSQDAERDLRARQREHDYDEWDEECDEDGCLHLHADEEDTGHSVSMDLWKRLVRPPGSVPTPPSSESSGV